MSKPAKQFQEIMFREENASFTTLLLKATAVKPWMKRGLAHVSLNFVKRNSEEEETTGVSPWSFTKGEGFWLFCNRH